MIQTSLQLKGLSLSLPVATATSEFFDSLANSTHVQTLGVQDNPYELSAQLLSRIGIGDGALARL